MKIVEFCMFHNEHAALDIKQREARAWVDELHLCEANQTFQGSPRTPVLGQGDEFLRPCLFDGQACFHQAFAWGPSRHFPFFRRKPMARKNETLQRNHVHEVLAGIADEDLVILSDIDEIIDSRHADEVVELARRHGIVSVELHHTLFYLNLYSANWHEVWPGSPPNYAYRVFVMTGAHFRKLREGSDRLRRRGEWGRLHGEVHLLQGFRGFHHSWLGDEHAALDKITAYCHGLGDHRADLLDEDGQPSLERLGHFIRSGQSFFPGNRLEIRSLQDIAPLGCIAADPDRYRHLML